MRLLGISFAPSGAIPAGVTGSVQYNSNSALDGDAYLIWDKPNQHLKLKPTVSPNNSALTIQDSAENIVTTFTYDGRIGVNQHPDSTALAGPGFAFTAPQQYYPQLFLENKHATAHGPYIFFAKQYGINTDIIENVTLGAFTWRGWAASAYAPLVGIEAKVGNPINVNTSLPTYIRFSICPYNAKSSQEAFRISPDKYIGINSFSPSASVDAIAKDNTSSNYVLNLKDSLSTPLITIRNDGGFAFKGGTVSLAQTGWTGTGTVQRNLTTSSLLADVINALSTLIADLKAKGILGV